MTPTEQLARARTAGLSYGQYLDAWRAKLTTPTEGITPEARRYVFYARYNWERSERTHAAYTPSDRALAALAALPEPLTLVVLTEDWCVDSAYALPLVAELAARTPRLSLLVLPRDEHADMMDEHLSATGGRSIPKLLAFAQLAPGDEAVLRFTWGPRSEAAEAFRQSLVAQGVEKGAISKQLAAWFDEGGWREAEPELAAVFEGGAAGG